VAINHPNWLERVLPVGITKMQVKNSPDIDTKKPVSRQHEMQFLGYYGYPYYWGGAGLWGEGMYPNLMMPGGTGFESALAGFESEAVEVSARAKAERNHDRDPHLRSCKAVTSYAIQATDGEIGHVQGLLVDEETWAVRYLVVNTSNWWLDHQVLIAPQWIQEVSWDDATVFVNLTRKAVQGSPPYDSSELLNRLQETGVYNHYGRVGYWTGEANHEAGTVSP
jgi:hypothetical protein